MLCLTIGADGNAIDLLFLDIDLIMSNMFRIYLIKQLTDMFFQGENSDKKHVVGVCIVFYAINSALFICLNISLINLICNVLGMRHDIRNHLSEIQLLTVWSLSSKH